VSFLTLNSILVGGNFVECFGKKEEIPGYLRDWALKDSNSLRDTTDSFCFPILDSHTGRFIWKGWMSTLTLNSLREYH
jgi:hypothetical protein